MVIWLICHMFLLCLVTFCLFFFSSVSELVWSDTHVVKYKNICNIFASEKKNVFNNKAHFNLVRVPTKNKLLRFPFFKNIAFAYIGATVAIALLFQQNIFCQTANCTFYFFLQIFNNIRFSAYCRRFGSKIAAPNVANCKNINNIIKQMHQIHPHRLRQHRPRLHLVYPVSVIIIQVAIEIMHRAIQAHYRHWVKCEDYHQIRLKWKHLRQYLIIILGNIIKKDEILIC